MGIKQYKVPVAELRLGMFVSKLDRPWTQTPFPLQGFYINDVDEISSLRLHCRHVYVDVLKGQAPKPRSSLEGLGKSSLPAKQRRVKPINVKPIAIYDEHRKTYPKARPVSREIFRADRLYQQVYRSLSQVLRDINTRGVIDAKEAVTATGAMVESVLRSPDAFVWLTKIRETDEHTYTHAIRAAIWSIIFGRHLGLNRIDLNALAVGVLLKDVGKTKIPQNILLKDSRNHDEQQQFQTFVNHSIQLLKDSTNITKQSLSVIRTHCERVNGTGFPQGLLGDRIPLLGKIAGIVTCYDELTNPRNAAPIAPSKAIAALYDYRNVEFQEDLVVHFIRAIGLYPPGTLVELYSGEVGVVLEQNTVQRLLPKLLLITDPHKKALRQPKYLDLSSAFTKRNDRHTTSDRHNMAIKKDLDPSSVNIDIDTVRNSYFTSLKRKSLIGKLKQKLTVI